MGRELITEGTELTFEVYEDSSNALAVSELVALPGGPQDPSGFLVFTFLKAKDGTWLIDDIDYEDYDGGVKEIDRFLGHFKSAELLTPRR